MKRPITMPTIQSSRNKHSKPLRRIATWCLTGVRWLIGAALLFAANAHAAYDVTIIASGASSNGAWVGNTWTPSADGSTVLASEVAAHLAAGPTAIEPANGGIGLGDININAAISWSANTTLTLWAANVINVNADITASGTSAGLVLTAPGRTSWPYVGAAASLDGIIFPAVVRPGTRPGITLSGANATLSIDGVAYTLIHDLNALQAVKDGDLAGHYALAGNIDATATATWNPDGSGGYLGFEPIAYINASNGTHYFSGTLQGLGHTITGLYINRANVNVNSESRTGLIGHSHLARVENLGLVGGSITAYNFAGGIIGFMVGGQLWNVYNSGEVRAHGWVGGLVGTAQATDALDNPSIANSYASGNVTARVAAGGLVGESRALNASFSFASGNVALIPSLALGPNPWPPGAVDTIHAGGLVGWFIDGYIRSCYATGDVTGAVSTNLSSMDTVGSWYVGGLVGEASLTAHVWHSYATGAVTGTQHVGGLFGSSSPNAGDSMFTYATGRVTGAPGASYVAGYAGSYMNSGGVFMEGYWDTESTGQANGVGSGLNSHLPAPLTGLTHAQMLQPTNIFTTIALIAPIDVNNESFSIWTQYPGHTAPLLRYMMTPLLVTADNTNATKTYDGTPWTGTLPNVSYQVTGGPSNSEYQDMVWSSERWARGMSPAGATAPAAVYNTATPYGTQTAAGTYSPDLWSPQFGYHIYNASTSQLVISPIVSKTADTRDGICDADCSLREAIDAVNAGIGGGTITIPAGTYQVTLGGGTELNNASGSFDILKNVTITGVGAVILDGGALDRVMLIGAAATVSLSGITIQNGNAAIGSGGGINNTGTLTVTNSTISGNTAANTGGGIANGGTLTVTNSTISGNVSANNGGGIVNYNGTLTVTNSTIVRNTASAGLGGGYFSDIGTGDFSNSIVADNGVGLDCAGTITVTDSGGNVDSDGTCGTFTQNATMVQGTEFGALANNGGPTQTHALLAGSAAIDAGTCVNALDQRGYLRPAGATCDIGAYEYNAVAADITPDPFSFAAQTGVALFTPATSNIITVAGINAAAPVSIAGGTYSINGGAYTSNAGTVSNGNTVTLQQTSSASYSTPTTATLTIGGVSGVFDVTTLAQDTAPAAFSFAAQTGVALNSVATSNTITVSGINAAAAISIVSGTYSINGGGYTSAAGTVNNGNTVTLKQTASASFSATTTATLTIGGVSGAFEVTTLASPAVVTSYTAPSATGTGAITASFTGGGAGCGYTVSQYIPFTGHAASPSAGSSPSGVSFPHGLFDFATGGCTAASTITLTITYPQALPAGTVYWKYGPTPSDSAPHWYVLPATIAGNTVSFTITDGGLGDDDLAANGTIVDQGGPGAGGAAGIPTLSECALLLLAGLIGLAGMAQVRRAQQRSLRS